MRVVLAALISIHALLHLMGVVKACAPASLEQLRVPVSRPMGLLWLTATVLLLAAVAALFTAPRWFWLAGLIAVAVSQIAIVTSWADARFGTVPNAILLATAVWAAFAWGPFGLRADYGRRVTAGVSELATRPPSPVVTEADLTAVPPQVARYLRFAGVVGTPRVEAFRVRMTGRIRNSETAPWMPFEAEQHSFYDPPRRFFHMEAVRAGLPVDGLHAYDRSGASMRIRLLSMFPVVDLAGPELARTETVTLLNDTSLFAPGRLLDPSIRWRELDTYTVEASYTNGPHTVRATLVFGDDGALVDFHSDDRPALADDGRTLLSQRWSTPVDDYRVMGPYRLATHGEGRYSTPDGGYAYIELEVTEVTTDLAASTEARR